MAKIFSYQIPQVITLVWDGIPGSTGFEMNYPVNVTDISVFRGMTTTIQVIFRTIDSRFATLPTGNTPQIVFYDSKGNVYFQSDLTLVDITQGLYSFQVTSTSLLSWTAGNLYYSISLRDSSNVLHPLYTDRNYTNIGEVKVIYGPLPNAPVPTTILSSSFLISQGISYTSAYPGPNTAINPSTQQTAAIYQTAFIGTVTVEATVDLQPVSDETQWFNVTTYTSSSAYTGTSGISFIGSFTYVRFVVTPQPSLIPNASGTVDQIIYQN